MSYFNVVAETSENTVVTEYEPVKVRSGSYQSEAALEQEFIHMLCEQGYTYLTIHRQKDLVANLKKELERLNGYTFSNSEWERFFADVIANPNDHIVEKTKKIQEDNVQVLKKDDGKSQNITLIDKKNIHNNSLQVINQYEVKKDEGAIHDNRYDVTILVNGLPMVQIELKKRGGNIREAFNQIERYQRDSFWADSGLYEYAQIFVISNGTTTKYYSNSTRYNAIKEAKSRKPRGKKTSNSFEFTSFWADAQNNVIADLVDFTKTFFAKHTLLNIITRYCVFDSDNTLLVMRPYQITATERILNRIEIANNYKKYGSIAAGGYIWHTTGSGKTLTSFKTARLATRLPYIDKVLFVVDRQDLDYQTMKEYDRFEKGAANSNTSSVVLERQLRDPNAKIIITTIQKLSSFIKKNKTHEAYDKKIVMIFDECHRSQFGKMHRDIVKSFKNYFIFGFTGTPIFSANANLNLMTTEQTFGDQLHVYTIVDAIKDQNVLPFRVDYIKTMKEDEDLVDSDVWDIERKAALESDKRIEQVTKYILDHFNQKTYRSGRVYEHNIIQNVNEVASVKNGAVQQKKENRQIRGFNSIFAVSSIEVAKKYYKEFKKQMAEDKSKSLRVAVIYSYGANEAENESGAENTADVRKVEDENGILDEENSEDTYRMDQPSRDFLDAAIGDYNKMFKTNYSTDGDRFQNYYKDVSLRMKNRELDILIVVNMFLTGFDATTLNTLWVDKNLKLHGLIQAFSRTNRILNSVKTFGNIVCFRNLQKRVDDACALFGDKDAGGVVLLKKFDDYYNGYTDEKGVYHDGYVDMIDKLTKKYPMGKEIVGEQSRKDFIKLFGAILRMRNLLSSFDEFKGCEIITQRDFQDYNSIYLDMRQWWKEYIDARKPEKEDITDDVVFEMELVKQVDIDIDYILALVTRYHESNHKDKELLIDIQKSIDASPSLRSKKKLIEDFIASLDAVDDVMDGWQEFVSKERERELKSIIDDEHLNEQKTRHFMENAFRDGEIKTIGTDLSELMPPTSLFGGEREKKKEVVIQKLSEFFERFFGIGEKFTAEDKTTDSHSESPNMTIGKNTLYDTSAQEAYKVAEDAPIEQDKHLE